MKHFFLLFLLCFSAQILYAASNTIFTLDHGKDCFVQILAADDARILLEHAVQQYFPTKYAGSKMKKEPECQMPVFGAPDDLGILFSLSLLKEAQKFSFNWKKQTGKTERDGHTYPVFKTDKSDDIEILKKESAKIPEKAPAHDAFKLIFEAEYLLPEKDSPIVFKHELKLLKNKGTSVSMCSGRRFPARWTKNKQGVPRPIYGDAVNIGKYLSAAVAVAENQPYRVVINYSDIRYSGTSVFPHKTRNGIITRNFNLTMPQLKKDIIRAEFYIEPNLRTKAASVRDDGETVSYFITLKPED